jgi:putative effector of murein hydrolase LrgA (UPF0299 family)
MVHAFALLLVCQLAGEGLAYGLALPLPGPVIGLVLLAAGLALRNRRARSALPDEAPLARAATGLLGHLSLLFVPAAVGIVQQGSALAANGWALGLALLASTILTLVVTASVFVWAMRLAPNRGEGA